MRANEKTAVSPNTAAFLRCKNYYETRLKDGLCLDFFVKQKLPRGKTMLTIHHLKPSNFRGSFCFAVVRPV